MSYLNIRCKVCDTKYTLMTEELNVLAFFKCSECQQHNAYVSGKVVLLDQRIMDLGTDDEKFEHVLDVTQKIADTFAENVLASFGRIIDINSTISLPAIKDRIEDESYRDLEKGEEKESQPLLLPSIVSGQASRISAQEVRDFVKIDLNLIDKRSYFDKIFGEIRNNN